jgi:hypothetical protein
MLLQFNALLGTVTVTGTISGKHGAWTITLAGPHGYARTTETAELFDVVGPLLQDMLTAAHDAVIRNRFPKRYSSEATP